MTTNGSELFLDRATRVRKIQQIAQFLASIENKDPQDRNLHNLAQKFENQIFSAAMNVEDYNNRINKKLTKVQKVRQQQAAAVQAKQGTQPLDQNRLHQQQQQQQQHQLALQQRRRPPHQRHPHQQVTGGSLLQQQGLPIQTSTATSGVSTPGAAAAAAAAAAAVTAAWPNQAYTPPDSTINNVPGISSVGGRGSRGPGGAYEGQAGNALVSSASQMGQGVDAAAQAAANVVASAAMGIPRQAAPLGPGSRGIGRNVSSGMVMPTGHGSGSTQSQVDAEDRAKQHRSLRAEELRNIYQEDIHYFVQHGSSLLKKLHKTRPASQNSEQVLKLVQYVKEGHNALLYINRCHDTGHVPSAASLHSLEHTLIRVHKASNALQVMIRDHSRTQQNNNPYGPGGGGGGSGGSSGGNGASSAAASAVTSAASIPTEMSRQFPGNAVYSPAHSAMSQASPTLSLLQQQGSGVVSPVNSLSTSLDPHDSGLDLEPIPLPENAAFGSPTPTTPHTQQHHHHQQPQHHQQQQHQQQHQQQQHQQMLLRRQQPQVRRRQQQLQLQQQQQLASQAQMIAPHAQLQMQQQQLQQKQQQRHLLQQEQMLGPQQNMQQQQLQLQQMQRQRQQQQQQQAAQQHQQQMLQRQQQQQLQQHQQQQAAQQQQAYHLQHQVTNNHHSQQHHSQHQQQQQQPPQPQPQPQPKVAPALGPAPAPPQPNLRRESSDAFWSSVDIGGLEPNPLDVTPLDDGLTANLDAGDADLDMPVEDLLAFDLDPFPLDGMPLDGDDWLSTQNLPDECSPRFGQQTVSESTSGTVGGATTRPGAFVPSSQGSVSSTAQQAGAIAAAATTQQLQSMQHIQHQHLQHHQQQQQLHQQQIKNRSQQQQLQHLQHMHHHQQQQVMGSQQLGNGVGSADASAAISEPQNSQPQTVVDRLAAVVSNGGPAAENLGRLAGAVSSRMGYRAPGSTASAESARAYLVGTTQDADLSAVEMFLGLGRTDGSAASSPTPNGLRNAGQSLSRHTGNAFEAMAAAADNSHSDPSMLRDVIFHQLGPVPRLLDGLVSGCSSVASASPTSAGAPGAVLSRLGNKRAQEDCPDGNERPQKKMNLSGRDTAADRDVTLGGAGAGGQPGSTSVTTTIKSEAGGSNTDLSAVGSQTTASENGGGASLSPAAAAPPTSNLLARPAAADFRHEGGEELMAVLRAKVGRLFTLDAEYTHVRRGKREGDKATVNGGIDVGMTAADGSKAAGLRRVLSRLKAVRTGQFVVNVKFDVTGNECRPCDVSVLSWAEADETHISKSDGSGIQAESDPWSEQNFLQTMEGTKPWRTSNHAVFSRVSSHAFKALHDFVDKRQDGNMSEALVSFFQWMSKYDRLFQDPCKIANKLVTQDSGTGEPLPPTLRTTDGQAIMPESLAGMPQREPQQPTFATTAGSASATAAQT